MTKDKTIRLGVVSFGLLLSAALLAQEQPPISNPEIPPGYGVRNPKAPIELSQFDFLIGHWRCEVLTKRDDGTVVRQSATWIGRYVLDGYAIEDEYRQVSAKGEIQIAGKNIRSFDAVNGAWVMKWFDATKSTWLDLGPKELGGVQFTESSIVYSHHHPPDVIVRITYRIISKNQFIWTAETSHDSGKTWKDTGLTIKARRTTVAD